MLTTRMLSLRTISRSITPYPGAKRHQMLTSIKLLATSSSDSSESGSDSDKESKKSKPKESVDDLTQLNPSSKLKTLHKLMNDLDAKTTTASRIDVAIPKKPPRTLPEKIDESSVDTQFEANLATAAKAVAEKIGGDIKKTEIDLLDRLLKRKNKKADEVKAESESSSNKSNMFKEAKISPDLLKFKDRFSPEKRIERVRKVSQRVDELQVGLKDTRSELSQDDPKNKKTEHKVSTMWDLHRERERNLGSRTSAMTSFRYHNLNFGIFDKSSLGKPSTPDLSTWVELEKKEMETLKYHPPENYFQEMIQWTEQGKIWRFPIDNEQGLEEQNVHFSKHVFLERHLKGWCPKKGPVRHFMELVCVGLSKNPFMTVEEKVGHIMWYKDYFGDKRDLLVEIDAIKDEDPSILPKPTNRIDLGPHV